MGIKIKITKRFSFKKLTDNIEKNFSKELKRGIEGEIISEILQGKSPVRGHKFKSYKNLNYKGRKQPVDMKQSGDMLNSLKVTANEDGVNVEIESDIAIHHQKGTKNMPIRKLLPTSRRDTFNIKITNFITNLLRKAVNKAIKKS